MSQIIPRPNTGNFTQPNPPILTPYAKRRPRKFLVDHEVNLTQKAAGSLGRYKHRDSTLILITYRHALRVSEIAALRWDQINFQDNELYVSRLKGSVDGVHPLTKIEIKALRKLSVENAKTCNSPYVFLSSRRGALHPRTIWGIIRRAGEVANLPFSIHPHMLRHACGHYLVSKKGKDAVNIRTIQGYFGHANIQNTAMYTALSASAYDGLFKD